MLVLLNYEWGWRETLRVFFIVTPLAWLVEYIGSTTGFPFGAYHYTPALAPLLGGVPLVIPFRAWARRYAAGLGRGQRHHRQSRGWRFVAVTALAFTAWDLFLDPQMVLWGYWVWTEPGACLASHWSTLPAGFYVPLSLPCSAATATAGAAAAGHLYHHLVPPERGSGHLLGDARSGVLRVCGNGLLCCMVDPMLAYALWTLIGFIAGSLPFRSGSGAGSSRRTSPNTATPTLTANVIRAGGKKIGALALALDTLKALIPVGIAYYWVGIDNGGLCRWHWRPSSATPFPLPGLQGREGGGHDAGNVDGESRSGKCRPSAGCSGFSPRGWRQRLGGRVCILALLPILLVLPPSWHLLGKPLAPQYLLAVWLGNLLILIYTHGDLSHRPRLRSRHFGQAQP